MAAVSASATLYPPHGMRVSQPWLQALQRHAAQMTPNFAVASQSTQQELVLQHFLQGDLHRIGSPALPADIQSWHNRQLTGLFVLQADEVVNIAATAKQRQEESAEKRCLKLMLTDGAQQISGLEYQYIQGLKITLPAGAKVAIKDATVRHGMLMLTPDNTLVLGGQVHDLELAHQKAVKRWTQPPSGRSSRQEIGPVDLYAATSAAAWAPDTQNTTRALNAGTTALPGQAGNAAPNARGPQVHQPAQATAAASGAPVSAPQGFTASGPAASQQIPQPTVPYEAAYTPPSQLQQHRQAPAGSNTGQVVQPGVTAVIGAAVVTQTLRPDSTASNSIIPPQSAINGQSGAPYARQATSSVQVVQPFHSAPMHSQLLGRQASGTSRLQLRPAIPVLQRPQPGLQPSPGVIELSPAQSGTIAHVPNHQHIAEIPDSPGLPQAAALPASHAADGAQQCVAPSASQPSRLRRQVVDSNSEDEAEARPAKRSAVSPLHAQPAAEHRPVLQQADADFEDYGNEPQMDEDMEDADNLDEDIADVSDAEQEYQQQAEEYRAAQSSSPHGANAQPTPNAHEATVDLTGDHTPQAQGMHPAVAACRAVMEEKQLQAIDALHELPFTTLQAITEHAANLPASHFPKTLRLNARLVRTLSKLQFKDEQFRPLDQYTIDVEIQDATDKCQAAIGHQILLPSIGMSPQELVLAVQAGGREMIAPKLKAMNALMTPYMKYTLVDVVLEHSAAKPVIVEWHDQWTEADRAAI